MSNKPPMKFGDKVGDKVLLDAMGCPIIPNDPSREARLRNELAEHAKILAELESKRIAHQEWLATLPHEVDGKRGCFVISFEDTEDDGFSVSFGVQNDDGRTKITTYAEAVGNDVAGEVLKMFKAE